MPGLPDCRSVSVDALVDTAAALRADGWRFITATAVPRRTGWTVLYHFERDQRLRHLRIEVARDEEVPAIDAAFPAAFLVENEMSELQGIRVTGMSIDYGGRLYRDFDGTEGWTHVTSPGVGETVSPVCAAERAAR